MNMPQQQTMRQRRQNSTAFLLLVGLAAVLCYLEDQQLSPIGDAKLEERNGLVYTTLTVADEDTSEENNDDEIDEAFDQIMYSHRRALTAAGGSTERIHFEELEQRKLLATLDNINVDDEDYDAAFQEAYNSEPQGKLPLQPIQPYSLQDAVNEASVYDSTFAVLVYNPQEDKFVAFYSKAHRWAAGNRKLYATLANLSFLLRKVFPERFKPDQPELALAIGSGDYPHVKLSHLPYSQGVAPVFEFGSAFRDPNMYPNMIPMAMPAHHHLPCYQEWVVSGTVCKKLKAAEKGGNGELVFGDEEDLEWKDLIPQLIWRGSDFNYLPGLTRPRPVKPYAFKLKEDEHNIKTAAIRALRENYAQLLPRWKGVVLTAEAEQDAKREKKDLAWADMKFPEGSTKKKHRDHAQFYLEGGHVRKFRGDAADTQEDLITFDESGISTGPYTSLHKLAFYKYHIDLGGGGGTTWTGTIQKLAMPGLLFHHVTPTKDYIHDRLQAWRHYIPVSHDLRDLKAKFDWAEAHPEEAKWIADQGTIFMRQVTTTEGYGKMFQEQFVEPLQQAIDAYQPVSTTNPDMTWMEVLQAHAIKMEPMAECNGLVVRGGCQVFLGIAR